MQLDALDTEPEAKVKGSSPTPAAAKTDSAKPASAPKSMLDVGPTASKPSVTSNKGGTDLKSKVEASGQTYDPNKYDYRVAPDGSIQRKAK